MKTPFDNLNTPPAPPEDAPWSVELLDEVSGTGESIRLKLFDESYVFSADEASALAADLVARAQEDRRRRG